MSHDQHERIARRAYALWEADGRPVGRADAHWAQAEAEEGGLGEEQAGGAAGPERAGLGALPGGEGALDEGTLEAGADEPDNRLPGEEEGETEARLQDGDGAGRPGRGIYAGP